MWIKCWYFLNSKKAFDLRVFLCLISPPEFYSLALVDTWRFSRCTRSLDRQVTWRVGGALSHKIITLPSLIVIGVVKLEMHLFANITWLHDRWVMWLDGCDQLNLSYILLKLVVIALAKVEIKLFFAYHVITWLMINESHDSVGEIRNHKGYSKSNRTQWQKYIYITNWGKLVLQIGAALFYYKLGQTLLLTGAATLLQIRASVVTNWDSY